MNGTAPPRESARLLVLRIVVVVALVLGVNYVGWRWLASVNWANWWIAVPLVLAETYSVIDLGLFGMTMWRARRRGAPPPAPAGATVDVFITTYNESIELVMATAIGAQRIRYPHTTWILDDGDRPAMRAAAEAAGIGYLTRGKEWSDRPRHAKAGNLNNALLRTSGEFILVLDADMVPKPEILHRTLGYFADEKVAFVQTPQVFTNVTPADPLGGQAPLFYGPILEGKDGWNAAFFCGSNAVLRREALMQLGIAGYVGQTERRVAAGLRTASRILGRAARSVEPEAREVVRELEAAISVARRELATGVAIGELTYRLQRSVEATARTIVAGDLAQIEADLAAIGIPASELAEDAESVLASLSSGVLSPLHAVEAAYLAVRGIGVSDPGEAQAVQPLATISVTEDMATSMRLHSLGWKSVFHNETLALGLAAEDLDAMLTQRLRWAQGTMQVFLRENPLTVRGLRLPQRLMYFSTMWNYLSGFTTVVYITAPVLFLTLGVLPVDAFSADFFWRFIPFLIMNQLVFLVAARGLSTWRGQQYSFALFPVWIQACVTAAMNVLAGVPLNFAVTPKTRSATGGRALRRIRWQIIAAAVLLLATIVGIVRLFVLGAEPIGTGVNVIWVIYDFIALSVLIGAVRYRGFTASQEAT